MQNTSQLIIVANHSLHQHMAHRLTSSQVTRSSHDTLPLLKSTMTNPLTYLHLPVLSKTLFNHPSLTNMTPIMIMIFTTTTAKIIYPIMIFEAVQVEALPPSQSRAVNLTSAEHKHTNKSLPTTSILKKSIIQPSMV